MRTAECNAMAVRYETDEPVARRGTCPLSESTGTLLSSLLQASGIYIDPAGDPLRYLEALMGRAPFSLMGQWGLPPAESWLWWLTDKHLALPLIAWAWVVAVVVFVGPLLVASRSARFWAAGMLLSLVPACASAPDNRNLLLVGVGGMGLVAEFLGSALGPGAPRRARAFAALLLVVHLVLAPLALPFAARAIWWFDSLVDGGSRSWPGDATVAQQELVMVGNPPYLYVTEGLMQRLDAGLPLPMRVRGLNSGPASLTRVDERSVLLEARRGALLDGVIDTLFRAPSAPFRQSQKVRLAGMDVEVTAVTHGLPTRALFTFPVALEDPSLRWVSWQRGVYVPLALPEVGKTVAVELWPAEP